jgi:hypothetical protein
VQARTLCVTAGGRIVAAALRDWRCLTREHPCGPRTRACLRRGRSGSEMQAAPFASAGRVGRERGAPIPSTVDPGRAEQTRPLASRSFVQWRAPPGRQGPRPLHGVWVDGRRDGSWRYGGSRRVTAVRSVKACSRCKIATPELLLSKGARTCSLDRERVVDGKWPRQASPRGSCHPGVNYSINSPRGWRPSPFKAG